MIDRGELLRQARSRGLTLGIIEKDYVLGWVLYAVKDIKELTFKGGTALAKIYFPRTWRLSEDLDLVTTREGFGTALQMMIQSFAGNLCCSGFCGPGPTRVTMYLSPCGYRTKAVNRWLELICRGITGLRKSDWNTSLARREPIAVGFV